MKGAIAIARLPPWGAAAAVEVLGSRVSVACTVPVGLLEPVFVGLSEPVSVGLLEPVPVGLLEPVSVGLLEPVPV